MRLKKGFIIHKTEEEYIVVATEEACKYFNGIVRLNSIGGEIVEFLKNEISKKEIVDKLFNKYDVKKDILEKDVEEILTKLKSAGIIE